MQIDVAFLDAEVQRLTEEREGARAQLQALSQVVVRIDGAILQMQELKRRVAEDSEKAPA